MSETSEGGASRKAPAAGDENFVPAWLAILVLVLLLAVMAVGGYVIRGVIGGDRRASSVADIAVEKWSKQLEADPEDVVARVNLGYAYQRAGRYEQAISEYERVLKQEPRNTGALYNLGIIYRRLKSDDKAEETLWKVLEIDPEHALAARELGEFYAERKEYLSLIRAVRPVVEEHEEIADLQYLMGLAYENTGKPDWAAARYRLALKYAPDYEKAREALDRLGETR